MNLDELEEVVFTNEEPKEIEIPDNTNYDRWKKEQLVEYINQLNERIEAIKYMEKENAKLQRENASLRDYTAMANGESQRMSLELHRTQNLLNNTFEVTQNFLATVSNMTDMASQNLKNAMSQQTYYLNLNKKENGGQ